jgi:hypothetical protein
MAVERLYGRVGIKNPRLRQKRPCAIIKMLLLPQEPGLLVDLVETSPNRVLAHDFFHAQQPRIDRVASQRRDVRIAPVAGQHRQKHRPEKVAFARCIRAREVHRTACNPTVEQAALLRILDEKRQLAEWRARFASGVTMICRALALSLEIGEKQWS